MKKSDIAKSALASLQATAAVGIFATGMALVPAEAAVDGFQAGAPDEAIYGCDFKETTVRTCQEE